MKASAEELRPLFLFEHLNDEQLAWLSAEGTVRDYAAGELICGEGDFAEFLFVLLDGEISLTKTVQDDVVQLTRSARPGVYGGATQSYLGDRIEQTYQHTLRATAPSRVFRLPGGRFAIAVREWFPMAMHLLEGLFFGMSNTRQLIDQRERLTALGTITAGLTHELNNPASAAARSSAELGERIRTARRRLAELATSGADIAALVAVQERLTEREAQIRRPMEISDAEGELSDWLEDHEVDEAWEIAPTLVTGEFGIPDAEELAASMGDGLPVAVRWLADALEISQLEADISEAVKRISGLLTSAKQYSQLDRAAYQTVDLRELLASTLTVLKHKIGPSVEIVTDYDPDLPPIPAYAAELNQVWTNLIDNALDAMGGSGTLTIRTARDGDCALVEIGDSGPGIPAEDLGRIFTPFFTTKEVGHGTGLGLDISWRIVVNRHHGDLRVQSKPGDTRFQVVLPRADPVPAG
ncbi:MAG: cyclic nucleotide-binding protein [Actinomycetia bacterium]|nr:cyclic nucleotide-binding protein [Actinomycetes bacterium]